MLKEQVYFIPCEIRKGSNNEECFCLSFHRHTERMMISHDVEIILACGQWSPADLILAMTLISTDFFLNVESSCITQVFQRFNYRRIQRNQEHIISRFNLLHFHSVFSKQTAKYTGLNTGFLIASGFVIFIALIFSAN